jgi:hypothetical protein
MTACMGGWCRIRAGCERYTQADRREPSERLCMAGRDGSLRSEHDANLVMEEMARLAESAALCTEKRFEKKALRILKETA